MKQAQRRRDRAVIPREREEDVMHLSSATSIGDDCGLHGVLRLPRVVRFGPGERRSLPRAAAGLGRRALICTDPRISTTPHFADLIGALDRSGVGIHVFAEVEAELPASNVLECARSAAGREIDLVIGIGGGSCIDMAKAASLLLAHGGTPEDYYGESNVKGPVLPIIAVPTTAGTGSEATPVAVLTDTSRGTKVGISSPFLIPHTAICDPDLTATCPPGVAAAAGADALTHLVESFTAVRRDNAPGLSAERVFIGKSVFTDNIALEGLKLMGRSLLRLRAPTPSTDARCDVMLAALAGGLALGTAGTAAAHALQYPVGRLTNTPHGVGVGVLLPYVMRYNFPSRLPEFAEIGAALGGDREGGQRRQAEAGVLAVDALLEGLGLPATLSALGVSQTDLDGIARRGLEAKRLVENNPRPLDLAAMQAIVHAAYEGDRSFPNSDLYRPQAARAQAPVADVRRGTR